MDIKVKSHLKPCAALSIAIMIVALVMTLTGHGMNLGVDFTGGTIMTYNMGEQFETADVEAVLADNGITDAQIAKTGEDDTQVQIRISDKENTDDLRAALESALGEKYTGMEYVDISRVGAIAGRDLINNAIKSVSLAAVLMLLYIAVRFDFYSGLAAIIGLLHDVAIMLSAVVLLRSFIRVETTFIAALLTIVGYSINNTIIIFDRCREMIKPLKGQKNIDYKGIGDQAVRASFTRTVFSTLTTMVTVVFLAILGGESIREFCVPIILGLIAGLYSALTIATPLWAAMSISFDKTKEKYAKRHNVSYDKNDDNEVDSTVVKDDEATLVQVKQAGAQKQKANTVYKYSKKNTTFKKKK